MKTSYSRRTFVVPAISVLALLTVFSLLAIAQTGVELKEDKISPPSEEQFTAIDALATPWRDSGCIWPIKVGPVEFPDEDTDCEKIRSRVYALQTIYDSDGSVWYAFSTWDSDKDYFLRYSMVLDERGEGYGYRPEIYGFRKEGFRPLATPGVSLPSTVLLRMVGESSHWYKVEINEKTRDIRYIAKNDSLWTKKSWAYWIYKGLGNGDNAIFGNKDREPLRDKPNGKVTEDSPIGEEKLRVLKVEGEWVYVRAVKDPVSPLGWIRWRNGRNFLLKPSFLEIKYNTIPELNRNGSTAAANGKQMGS
jgi:hypothetical protein